jgi:peptidoglycan hydrolase-like protein with peptidoglycan-binding domain
MTKKSVQNALRALLYSSLMAIALSTSAATADTLARDAQSLLTRLGYDVGKVDGSYGAKTEAALISFFAASGTTYDGMLDTDEIAALKAYAKANNIRLTPLPGYEIENAGDGLLYGPDAPGLTKWKYAFGFFWTRADWNSDGIQDFLYTGTMIPNNSKSTGEDTSGACDGGPCTGEMPGPTLYLGQSDGTYSEASRLFRDERDVPGQSLARQDLVADYNGDGILDLFIADHAIGTHLGIRDSYFLSQSDGTWLESSATHLSSPNYQIFDHGGATGDIDDDGDMDIVLTELKNQLTCWLNDGSGHMTKRKCGSVNAFGIELGDIDGDGDLDLVHAGHEFEGSSPTGIALNNGSGKFKAAVNLEQSREWSTVPEVAVWDLDADGDLDIVTSRAGKLYVGTAVQVLENLGNMTFRSTMYPLITAPAGYRATNEGNEWNNFVGDVRFADVDRDGDIDILLVGGGMNQNAKFVRAAILRNIGAMRFEHIVEGAAGNPVKVLNDALFKDDPEQVQARNDAIAAEKLAVVSGSAQTTAASTVFAKRTEGEAFAAIAAGDFTAFAEPILFVASGAAVLGAGNLDVHSDWLSYDISVDWAGHVFPVSVCVEYYAQHNFLANRINFVSGQGFGGLASLKQMGVNSCKGSSGFAGTWELPPEAANYGIDIFLQDLERNGLGIIARLPTLAAKDRVRLMAAFSQQ